MHAHSELDDDNDELDGCDIDYAEHQLGEDESEELFALFPEGADEAKSEEWKQLFS